MQGTVIKSTGNACLVRLDNGNRLSCTVRGNFRIKGIQSTNPVAVGDIVTISKQKDDLAQVDDIAERTNYIIRKATKLSKRSHIIAANMDRVFLMVTLTNPQTHLLFIDRFLVTAEAYHIPAEILINKTDLYSSPEQQEELDAFIKIYEQAGYPCHAISVFNNEDITRTAALFKGKVSLIAGNSGVGKSSLINAMDPRFDIKTASISNKHQSGKHTTTFAEMYELANGGFIIDTPGLKSFATYDLEKEDLFHRFPEMRNLIGQCKFDNCQHISEPKCAVMQAVETGQIPKSRYENYLNIYQGDELEGFSN